MTKLNQVNALVAGKKGEVQKELTKFYHTVQKKDLFDGLQRTYRPLDEEKGEKLPGERKLVQYKAKDLMKVFAEQASSLVDLIATQDYGNQQARANIVVDGTVVLSDVPVTTLLFLEKQVNDWITFMTYMHTPELTDKWTYDANQDLLVSEPVESVRTKKVPRSHIKYEATQQHPAQVEMYYEDVQVGKYTVVSQTSRLPAKEKNDILTRLQKLKDAVKTAREQANMLDVKPVKLGETLFAFAFGLSA